jgi:hypothetical protein
VLDPPRAIGWLTGTEKGGGELEFGGWIWRYDLARLGPSETEVTLTYDWSAVPQFIRERGIQFPPFGPEHLTNSLHHLAELVAPTTGGQTPGGRPAQGFRLEGNAVVAVESGHTDTDKTSVLHVLSIGLVVAGDVAYNGVHQYILEGAHGGLQEWLRAIDRVAGLHPRAVVAGHKNKNRPDDPAILDETRQYLQDVIRLLDDKPTAQDFYDQMTGLYPDRLNPGVVWLGARGLLGG